MTKKFILLTSMFFVLGLGTVVLAWPPETCEDCMEWAMNRGQTCPEAYTFCRPYYGPYACPAPCN